MLRYRQRFKIAKRIPLLNGATLRHFSKRKLAKAHVEESILITKAQRLKMELEMH